MRSKKQAQINRELLFDPQGARSLIGGYSCLSLSQETGLCTLAQSLAMTSMKGANLLGTFELTFHRAGSSSNPSKDSSLERVTGPAVCSKRIYRARYTILVEGAMLKEHSAMLIPEWARHWISMIASFNKSHVFVPGRKVFLTEGRSYYVEKKDNEQTKWWQ